MIPIETDRGCPYTCRFCEAPALVEMYKEGTGQHYFRRKSWDKVKEEIQLYTQKYAAEYIYFNAETFLAMSRKEFDQFVEMYDSVRLPFWMQTRVETLSEHHVQGLEKVGCNRISIGLEHGNEEFRKTIVGKGFSNQAIIDVFKILDRYTIPITINNIIGFPGETRELIFDTIEAQPEAWHRQRKRLHLHPLPRHGYVCRRSCQGLPRLQSRNQFNHYRLYLEYADH